VDEYLHDLDLAAAYRRAGYQPKSAEAARTAAHRLLRKVTVQAAIRKAFRARSERTEITQDYVLRRLKAEAEWRGKGSSHAARIRGIELLGRHVGLFADRPQHDHRGKVEHEMRQQKERPTAKEVLDVDVSHLTEEQQRQLLNLLDIALNPPPKEPPAARAPAVGGHPDANGTAGVKDV
jgi:phage terminase small subunit